MLSKRQACQSQDWGEKIKGDGPVRTTKLVINATEKIIHFPNVVDILGGQLYIRPMDSTSAHPLGSCFERSPSFISVHMILANCFGQTFLPVQYLTSYADTGCARLGLRRKLNTPEGSSAFRQLAIPQRTISHGPHPVLQLRSAQIRLMLPHLVPK